MVTTEIQQALESVNEINVKRDQQVRDELSLMAKKLETGFAALETTATSAQASPSAGGLDLVLFSMALDGRQAKLLDSSERLQTQLTVTVARVRRSRR